MTRFEAESAGLEPGKLNPCCVEAMAEVGIDISQNPTKSVWDVFKSGKTFGYVVTVCDETSAERCPIFPGVANRLHWSFRGSFSFTGTHEEKLAKVRVVRERSPPRSREWCEEKCGAGSARRSERMRKLFLAEFLGTAALVFAGTGAIVINDVSGGAITHAGIARDIRADRDGDDLLLRRRERRALQSRRDAGILGRAPIRRREGGPVSRGANARRVARERTAARALSHARNARRHAARGAVAPVVHSRSGAHVSADAGDPQRLDGREGEGHHRRDRHRRGHRTRSDVRRADLRRVDESRALARACGGQRPTRRLWIYLAAPVLGALLAIPACQGVREPGAAGRACA